MVKEQIGKSLELKTRLKNNNKTFIMVTLNCGDLNFVISSLQRIKRKI